MPCTRCSFSCNLQHNSTLKRCKSVTNVWYVKSILANCDGNMYLPILHLSRVVNCTVWQDLQKFKFNNLVFTRVFFIVYNSKENAEYWKLYKMYLNGHSQSKIHYYTHTDEHFFHDKFSLRRLKATWSCLRKKMTFFFRQEALFQSRLG